MLQKLRDQTQSRTFQVIVILLIVSLALFGFGAFNVFQPGDVTVASVNGEDITATQLNEGIERERRRLTMQYGDQLDAAAMDPASLQGPVLQQLISREILAQALDTLDIQAARSNVDKVLLENPNFQIGGAFDDQVYRRTVSALGYTPQRYLEETRLVLSIEQLSNGVSSTSMLNDWEVRQLAKLVSQKRDLAYLEFTTAGFEQQVELSEEEIDTYYFENELQYVTPETLDVIYVVLDQVELMDDPSIEITEEQILATYEADKADADGQEGHAGRQPRLPRMAADQREDGVHRTVEHRRVQRHARRRRGRFGHVRDGDLAVHAGGFDPLEGRPVVQPEHQDGADDDNSADGVRDAHQRRMQGVGDVPDDLPTDKAGKHEHREVLHESGWRYRSQPTE